MDILYFILTGLSIFACVADYITTVLAMGRGGVEGNPINRWLFSKIGAPSTTFLEIVFYLFISAALFQTWGEGYATAFSAFICALETDMAVHNYRIYKK